MRQTPPYRAGSIQESVCTLVPQTWDEHIRVFAAWPQLFSLPEGCSPRSPTCSPTVPHPKCLSTLGRWESAVTPRPRVRGRGPGRLRDSPGGSCGARDGAGHQTPGPGRPPQKGSPFPSRGKIWARFGSAVVCKQSVRFYSFMLCQVANGWRVLRVGSSLVFLCFQKGLFLQPALAEPCGWHTFGFLQWFKFAESCFAFSDYTA